MSMVRWSASHKLSYQTTMGIISGRINGALVAYRYTCRLVHVLEDLGYVFAPNGFHVRGAFHEVRSVDQEVTLADAPAQTATEQEAAS